jgi:hypothetical protein
MAAQGGELHGAACPKSGHTCDCKVLSLTFPTLKPKYWYQDPTKSDHPQISWSSSGFQGPTPHELGPQDR